MKKSLLLFLLSAFVSVFTIGQSQPLTIAESSDYTSTSRYEDVMNFIKELESSYSIMRLEIMATSTEGRDVPLLVIADPIPNSPISPSDDRLVVYIQANIHAGEVEGKEATQMLARDLLKDHPKDIFDNLIILICPNLNPDGNEKISTKNRTRQNGPENGVGVRHNGQFLDLNRDAMKLETPEISGVVTNVLNTWDPAIVVDCHTTNGSYHEEPVTFTWGLNPNGDRTLINYMRDQMMPKVSDMLWEKHNVDNVFYGTFIDRGDYSKGWISYASEPRYLVNYIGVRNRLAILNENYSYADYKSRVWGSYYLLWSILDYAAKNKDQIKQLLEDADEKTVTRGLAPAVTDSFAIEYEGKPTPEDITIKAYELDEYTDDNGRKRYRQSDRKITVTVPYIADYYPTKNIRFPYAYILEPTDPEIINLIKSHGVLLEQLDEETTLSVERFKIEELKGAERLYQGHYMNDITGEFVIEEKTFPAGTYIVYTAQPLGCLAAYLLEPQSDDGFLKWNVFDRYLVPQWGRRYYPYPVYRILEKVELSTFND